MRKTEIKVGDRFETNNCGPVVVTKYVDSFNVYVRFEDGVEASFQSYDVRHGRIKNKNSPCVFGIGYLGYGEYNRITHRIEYDRWSHLFQKCYAKDYREYGYNVDPYFHSFQNFCTWISKQVGYKDLKNRHLVKNILQKHNKIYSPDTCCLVPNFLDRVLLTNEARRGKLPLGINKENGKFRACCRTHAGQIFERFDTLEEAFDYYKQTKEKEIKYMATKYKHLLDPKVYVALMNYEVDIND